MRLSLGLCALSLLGLARAQDSTYNPPPADQGTDPTPNNILTDASRQANPQLSNLLGNLLWFYEAQRSGKLPDTNRVAWRNDSLLDDGMELAKVDLSGGLYDAGSYIKCTFPLSWTLQSIAWGALNWGKGYTMTNQEKYLDEMLRWSFDWMMKASNTPDTLYMLVGDPVTDNNYWGGDQNIPSPRPAYAVSKSKPGTDAFAAAAGAFAAGAYLYSGGMLALNGSSNSNAATPLTMLRNTTYANTLRDRAVSLWNLAQTSQPMQVYQTAVPEITKTYPSTDYLDDLVMGGAWTALATGNRSYADAAVGYYTKMLEGSGGKLQGALNWDSKAPATAVLLAQIANTKNASSGLGLDAARFTADADAYLDGLTHLRLRGTDVSLTPGSSNTTGLLWIEGTSNDASLNPALNTAFLLQAFAGLASGDASQRYRRFADWQMDYTLGKNPMNAVYVVGQHPNSPQNPHSAPASGGTDIGKVDTSPRQEAHVLYGAVVGGPAKNNKFYDQRSDYIQTEVALDYNAPMLGLTAARVQYQAENSAPSGISALDAQSGGPFGDPVFVALAPGTRVRPTRDLPEQSGGGITLAGKMAIGIAVAIIVLIASAASGWFFGRNVQVK